ncbi:hypothetical protein SRHO_G00276830 [Serrasalmus rhombeus]
MNNVNLSRKITFFGKLALAVEVGGVDVEATGSTGEGEVRLSWHTTALTPQPPAFPMRWRARLPSHSYSPSHVSSKPPYCSPFRKFPFVILSAANSGAYETLSNK